MHGDLNLKQAQNQWHGSLKSYLIGFGASLAFTATSFFLVVFHLLTGPILMACLIFLALTQAAFQLRYFLHLGQEEAPKWESVTFYFMLLLLVIIVLGSLWIMHDLDTRVMADMSGMVGHHD